MNQTALLLAGLSAHAEQLAKRGLDAAFVAQFNLDHNKHFKARLMEKTTAERVEKSARVGERYSLAKSLIKLELPPETWREFGIVDQR
ncbi:hypothetical protein EDC14_104711 [Hydrogenispora ethanolica]|uniref:Uncharacterized protein n=1 Tax=Hydrogenispora ethanolica TaxID=1082276 RepID=A0A4R1QTD3_HYDET|nr:hypothetical protein [Hydrogenispora ethanolica]TCL57108.1 hypothetical protein EDC14_104711 [Hydrogenispora ethanolica]